MATEAEIIGLIGIGFAAFGIAAIWIHPRRWKIAGTVLALIGLAINVGNVFGIV